MPDTPITSTIRCADICRALASASPIWPHHGSSEHVRTAAFVTVSDDARQMRHCCERRPLAGSSGYVIQPGAHQITWHRLPHVHWPDRGRARRTHDADEGLCARLAPPPPRPRPLRAVTTGRHLSHAGQRDWNPCLADIGAALAVRRREHAEALIGTPKGAHGPAARRRAGTRPPRGGCTGRLIMRLYVGREGPCTGNGCHAST